jgi:hypothetical protein
VENEVGPVRVKYQTSLETSHRQRRQDKGNNNNNNNNNNRLADHAWGD